MGEADYKSLIATDPESAAKLFVDKDRQVQVIPRSPVGVGLLISILISKYQDHQPLHRQEEMSARFGYEVPRNRMREWLGALSELCLYRAEQKDCNSGETQAIRSKVSAPLVLELHKYLTAWSNRTLPRSPVQKAIHDGGKVSSTVAVLSSVGVSLSIWTYHLYWPQMTNLHPQDHKLK